MKEDQVKEMFESYGGVMKTSELAEHGIRYRNIQKLIEEGAIEQVRRGYYQYLDETAFTEVPAIKALFPDGVLCMESALDYYGYTERTPSAWHIAVDARTSRRKFKVQFLSVKPHFVEEEKFPIGITSGSIAEVPVLVYDRERTICDCLLHKNKMDPEVFNDAIKNYIRDPKKNQAKLGEYASKLHVEKKMREVLGPWL